MNSTKGNSATETKRLLREIDQACYTLTSAAAERSLQVIAPGLGNCTADFDEIGRLYILGVRVHCSVQTAYQMIEGCTQRCECHDMEPPDRQWSYRRGGRTRYLISDSYRRTRAPWQYEYWRIEEAWEQRQTKGA